MATTSKKTTKIRLEIIQARALELKPGHKYLMIMPKDSKVIELQDALKKYLPDVGIFVLAVNDVNDIKLAELIKET